MWLWIIDNGNSEFPGSAVLFRCFDHDKKCPLEPRLIFDRSHLQSVPENVSQMVSIRQDDFLSSLH